MTLPSEEIRTPEPVSRKRVWPPAVTSLPLARITTTEAVTLRKTSPGVWAAASPERESRADATTMIARTVPISAPPLELEVASQSYGVQREPELAARGSRPPLHGRAGRRAESVLVHRARGRPGQGDHRSGPGARPPRPYPGLPPGGVTRGNAILLLAKRELGHIQPVDGPGHLVPGHGQVTRGGHGELDLVARDGGGNVREPVLNIGIGDGEVPGDARPVRLEGPPDVTGAYARVLVGPGTHPLPRHVYAR